MMHTCSYCEQQSRHDIHLCLGNKMAWCCSVLATASILLSKTHTAPSHPEGAGPLQSWATEHAGQLAECACRSPRIVLLAAVGSLARFVTLRAGGLACSVTLRLPHCWCWVEAGMMQCSLALRIRLVALVDPEGRDHRICLVDPKDAHHAYPL